MSDFLATAETSPLIVNGSAVSWLARYLAHAEGGRGTRPPRTARDLVASLRTSFFPLHPEFSNDVVFSADFSQIVASRFYVTCTQVLCAAL